MGEWKEKALRERYKRYFRAILLYLRASQTWLIEANIALRAIFAFSIAAGCQSRKGLKLTYDVQMVECCLGSTLTNFGSDVEGKI